MQEEGGGGEGAQKQTNKQRTKKNIDLPLGHGKDRSDEKGMVTIGQ